MIYQNLSFKGTLVASRSDIAQTLDLAKRGKIKPVNSVVCPFDQLPEAVELVRQGKVAGRCIVDFNQ